MKVQLNGKDCPITVGNFVDLVQRRFYNGSRFHRHEPNFVIQGGDPNSRNFTADQIKNGDSGTSALGQGDPGYKIKSEYSSNPNNQHNDGALAMARSSDPNSGGSQFYFCLGEQHSLDSGYTVFGQTIEGLDLIKLLEKGDEIISITIENLHH
ncbi:MAG: peptidylprolyl isomerase [Eggerthellaceae bacterium]|nr:peptidylprolyl isomerase [Eggerthellaceae bacterium]